MTESENRKQEEFHFLQGGGEMGALIRAYDWSSTPLGPPHHWPNSLKTSVGIMLRSSYPMFVWWGKEMIMFHNDAYVPVLGKRHPEALGKSGPVIWSDVWEFIGPLMYSVLNEGKTSFFERQLLIPERKGFKEETYFTFSYSPIPDDISGVGGVFCACSEDTRQVLSQRRLSILQSLSEPAFSGSIKEVFEKSAEILAQNPNDLPFGLFYSLTDDRKSAQLEGAFGIPYDAPASPLTITLEAGREQAWPLSRVKDIGSGSLVIDNLPQRFKFLPSGPWEEPPAHAIIIPLKKSGQDQPVGFFISGISPRLEFDDAYKSFFNLVAGQLSTAIAKASALEEERRRTEKLVELDKAKTNFFSNISHEFRTPLTLILRPLEDILSAPESTIKAQKEQLDAAYRNALRLQKLVNSLLDFSRIEAGRAQASYQAVNLSELTAELASMFRSALDKAGLNLIVDCPPLPKPVYVDRDMWEKIVLNLLSNAFKHTFEGEIEVRLQCLDKHVELEVRDSGIGIPEEQLPHLFERFHRVPNARSRTHEGSGIGLSLVHELVKLHGGEIVVDSVVDQGTSFVVSIPTGKAHLPADRVEAEPHLSSTALGAQPFVQEALRWLPEERSAAKEFSDPLASDEQVALHGVTPPGKARILLADDNADMRDYVGRLLERYYEVEAVPDGKAALEAAHQNPPDLILSDVLMPGMDGFELLSALRADETLSVIPVILLSARAGGESAIEGLEAGADDYLVKPFSAKELIVRVNTNLSLSRLRMNMKAMEKLAKANKELKRVNTDLDNFIYTASHDLKAPIINIEGLVNLLYKYFGTENNNNQKVQAVTGMIYQSINRFKNTIADLTEIAKVQSHGEEEVSEISFKEMFEEAKSNIKSLIDESNAYIEEDFSRAPVISFSRKNLRSILYNLVSNAIKYRSPERPVHIRVTSSRPDNTHILLSVQDNGIGIKEEDKPKVFMMFKRLNQHVEGTGVGMAIVKKIIDNNGGKIEIESEKGKGTLFKVFFKI